MRDYSRHANVGVIMLLALCGVSMPPFRLGNQVEYSKHTKVQADVQSISTQLKLYESMNGFMPTTEQGIMALIIQPQTRPTPTRWYQLFKEIPKDPWQNPYIYRNPGTRN